LRREYNLEQKKMDFQQINCKQTSGYGAHGPTCVPVVAKSEPVFAGIAGEDHAK
jgi:hypothetical protein